jgi:Na+/H+-dicarboxylate symporter
MSGESGDTAIPVMTRKFRLFPSTAFAQVIWGLSLGLFVGVFFGEEAGVFGLFGDAYVRLLQMTVVPYVLVSLIGGLGKLDLAHARRIGIQGGMLILFLWFIAMIGLLALPLAYPDWEAASFFSTTTQSARIEFDPLLLYLPANPFFSLANTILPAVVVFSILMGAALISVPDKSGLLRGLDTLTATLMKITSWVARLAPLGIFAIAANAAGTVQTDALEKLQVYLWAYVGGWLILTFVILPLLVAWATPFSARDVMRTVRTPFITAIATGTVLIVLPMMAERCKALLDEHRLTSDDANSAVDLLVPTAYSFPSVGTLLGLGFILFAAWFTGVPLTPDQYPKFSAMGLFSAFGQMAVALPFLLDVFQLPSDMFQLFLLGSVITGRLATGLAAMHGVVIALLGATAMMGILGWRKLMEVAAIGLLFFYAAMAGLGLVLTAAIPYNYQGLDIFVSKRLTGAPVEVVGPDSERPPALSAPDLNRSRLDVIRERGVIRVGYFADRLPYAYRNNLGETVGMDMDLAHAFARDFDLKLAIVRLQRDELVAALNSGQVDLMVGGLTIVPEKAIEVAFSRPYTYHSAGFLVKDHERNRYSSLKKMQKLEDLKIGVATSPYFEHPLHRVLPNARTEQIRSPRQFLRGEIPEMDAVFFSAEAGGAWTLVFPQFAVARPTDLSARLPAAIAMPRHQGDLLNLVDSWITTKLESGYVSKLFDHWVMGKQPDDREPRWSILRNVIGFGRDEETDETDR